MKRMLLLVAVSAGALGLMFGHADAVSVTFFDNDNVTPPLQAVVNVAGTSVIPSVTFALVGEMVTVNLTGAFLGPNAAESRTLVLLESVADPTPSDAITISKLRPGGVGTTETGISIVFISDAPGSPVPACGPSCQPEFSVDTGLPANPFFDLPIFTTAAGTTAITGGLQINAFSDAEAVPEPTTLLLLGSSLIGLGALRYKRISGR